MSDKNSRVSFASDYLEGAHPAIMERLNATNFWQTAGYGEDEFSAAAREKIRLACKAPKAAVYFLTGGTQTNAVVIDALLRSYQGVLAAGTGHISLHEAGAIEFGGHKVLAMPETEGKIIPEALTARIESYRQDENRAHMVMPGMVYITQPTEYGTLYSIKEITALKEICRRYELPLYVDGARLAYALASPVNDVTLKDLARLCDVFYIGGTKCGALLGEAVVMPQGDLVPGFFSIMKQHGALLAKGRLLGIQFDTLFTDNLYERIGAPAIAAAKPISEALTTLGYQTPRPVVTNQLFVTLSDEIFAAISQEVILDFWEKEDATHTTARIATSWATTTEATEKLIAVLKKYAPKG
ncbi:MAG: aminotransferase class V-fold PLP-dependent enzyme [Selenomonadaceae bacterium]|nr:aminotransferase class V-fold PLP-dependent enzyme [Selenomonadaceae bacterium]